jgi:hypothetical protein
MAVVAFGCDPNCAVTLKLLLNPSGCAELLLVDQQQPAASLGEFNHAGSPPGGTADRHLIGQALSHVAMLLSGPMAKVGAVTRASICKSSSLEMQLRSAGANLRALQSAEVA